MLQQGLSLKSLSGISLVSCLTRSVLTSNGPNNVHMLSPGIEGSWQLSGLIVHGFSSRFTCSVHIVRSLFLNHTMYFPIPCTSFCCFLFLKMLFPTPQTLPFKSLFPRCVQCHPVLSFIGKRGLLLRTPPDSLSISSTCCHYSMHSSFLHSRLCNVINPPEPLSFKGALCNALINGKKKDIMIKKASLEHGENFMRLLINRKLNIVIRAQTSPSYLGLTLALPLIGYKTNNKIFKICVL